MCEFCDGTYYLVKKSDYDDSGTCINPNYCPGCGKPPIEPEPLTLDELRNMVGEPIWIPKIKAYAIVVMDKVGQWANVVFAKGVCYVCNGKRVDVGFNFEYNVESRKLDCYRVK